MNRQRLAKRVPPSDGDQLRLDLFRGEPWDGVSPRVLTSWFIGLSLRPEPPGHEVGLDPAQLDFFRGRSKATKRKRPQQTAGASLLLPLKKGRRSRSFATRYSRED